jgi:hypothetical protein
VVVGCFGEELGRLDATATGEDGSRRRADGEGGE